MQPDLPHTPGGVDPVLLIQQHQAGLWRYLRSLGCETALAEDLVQETFLVVLEKPFVDQGPAATTAYLRKIALHRFITYQRRARKVIAIGSLEEITTTWERLATDDQGEAMLAALRECFAALTPRARQALEMRFQNDQTREAIATMLEITEHGAKNLMQRAKQQLRTCIEQKIAPPKISKS
jgi:RNA polymerase sigma-70 factor, ECF subfamily